MGLELTNNNKKEEQYQAMEDMNDDFSDFELVTYVRDALKSVALGDNDNYSQLEGLLHYNARLRPDEVALLVTTLKALSGAVSYIDHMHHASLLTTIFNMSMWNYGPDVVDALVELITSLAASSGKYVDDCLRMLVSNFTPPDSFLQALNLPFGVARKGQVLVRVHAALECIAGLVPLAPSRLPPIITKRMETVFHLKQEPVVVMFVENVFKLESSAIGELVGSGTLIRAVVDLLIYFDAEIPWKDILEDPPKGIFDMELEDEQMFIDSDDDDEVEFSRESVRQKRLRMGSSDKLEKLDSLIVLTFEHLKFCQDSGRLVEVFEAFLQSFQLTVLTLYKSKFAQFVIFYACSLDPGNCGVRFAELLAKIFVSSGYPPLNRMCAIAYLASYLSRGRFLSNSFVTGMLGRLVKWCSDYCELQNVDINPKAHRVFYAGCQAIMYVFCFRMRSIMDIPHLKSQLPLSSLKQILKSPLQPLKVCLPSIVEEFVQQAKAVHFIDESGTHVFHDMLESELSRAFGGIERLDMFFPFDPCLLRKSDSYIRPNFVYWSMVRKTDDDEDEGSSDEEIDVFYPDMNRANSRGVGISESFEEDYLDEFNDSLDKMSITPKPDSLLRKAMRMPSRLRPSMSPESL